MKDRTSMMFPELTTEGPDTISADTASLVSLGLMAQQMLIFLLRIFALVTGILNVLTFAMLDLNQGVNYNLLLLSVSDLWAVTTTLAGFICSVFLTSGYYYVAGVSVVRVWLIFRALMNYPLSISFVVTSVIAVVRCLCVTMPLSFRDIVTSGRQLIIITVGSFLSLCLPLYVHLYGYIYTADTNGNSSQTTSLDPEEGNSYIYYLFTTTFYCICFIINVFSMVILSVSLKMSSKFQISMTKAETTERARKKFSRREAKVMKTVISLLAASFFCSMPLIVLSVSKLAIPELGSSSYYKNRKQLVEFFAGCGVFLSVGLNLPIYYLYNNQYRLVLKSMFRRSSV
ncbi:hypothetical protein RRG08_002500 [Elysia crispata]|uniref:G-protein coupled receptors family 1 profile domain-containing protein n=1 Tax=Elysia crispata TaxID=231223 RepID=A0AAE1A7T8_9GAST|nr:hypothetical protein RRG08_002500 [Elysia crispata]